jgi:hypothetical protein
MISVLLLDGTSFDFPCQLIEALRRQHGQNVHIVGSNTLYLGLNPSDPRIGEVKVSSSSVLLFSYISGWDVLFYVCFATG